MPSSGPSRLSRLLRSLRSQGLGVICGLATTLLLAAGSFVLSYSEAGVRMDDVRAFFTAPRLAHLWFYLLVPVLGLYALNVLLASWHSVISKLRAGVRSPAAYAASVIHLAFLVALLAHGVGGLFSEERGGVLVTHTWQPLPDGREVRLRSLEVERLPGGMPKAVSAQLELRAGGGQGAAATAPAAPAAATAPTLAEVGFNAPLSSGLGSELYLLARQGHRPAVAHLRLGADRCALEAGSSCRLGPHLIAVRRILERGRGGGAPPVQIWVGGLQRGGQLGWLMQGRPAELPGGQTLRLERVESKPWLLLRARHAPGNPIALASALLLLLGLGMMWRRFAG